MTAKGKLIIFSAPSGSGKTTLENHILEVVPNLAFSVSATSRKPRGEERDGVEYYFISAEEFREKIARQEFLEWEEVYEGTYYGTLLSEVERLRNQGKHVVFDVDVVGGHNIKQHYGEEALFIFIQTPSLEVLRERLVARNTDSEESIRQRLDKAQWEINYVSDKYDIRVVNDDLTKAKRGLAKVVTDFVNGE